MLLCRIFVIDGKEHNVKGRGKVIVFILCFLAFLFVGNSIVVDASDRIIKVGYAEYKGFIEKDEDDNYTGYAVEYLQKIAEYTGFQYEFVNETVDSGLKKLENHEIDLWFSSSELSDRDSVYEYSNQSFGMVIGNIYTRKDNINIYYEDFEHMDGMKIGVIHDSLYEKSLSTYANMNGFEYEQICYEDSGSMITALTSGAIDAFATEHTSDYASFKIIGQFTSHPFYFASYKDNNIMSDINRAMATIDANDVLFRNTLLEKYFGKISDSLCITREEGEYIKNTEFVRVGQLRNRYPLSDYNEETGELSGINEDVLQLISEKTGLKFVSEPLLVDENPLKVIQEDRFDLIMGISDGNSFVRDKNIAFSNSYLQAPLYVVAKKDVASKFNLDDEYTMAMKTSFSVLQDYISVNYPNFKMKFYSTDEECFEAVKKGEVDLYVQNSYIVNYLRQKPRFSDFEILQTTFFMEDSKIIANTQTDRVLMSIINKAIDNISDNEINEIIVKSTMAEPYVLTNKDILYEYSVYIIVVGILFLLCISLLVIIAITRQRHVMILENKNKELSEAVISAKQANNTKSEFLARISHEIRTPMNAIVGLTLIAKKNMSDERRVEEYLDKIDSSSKILLSIINDVLDMSAIESKKMKISHKLCDVNENIATIATMYYSRCKQKGIEFDVILDGFVHDKLIGDALRTNQIVLNLVSNAYKFTDSGGSIKVVLSEKVVDKKTVMVVIDVTDTGIGMSKEMQEKLFESFVQESAETAQKYGGSGLGMAITWNLVKLMNGTISVKSAKNVGTEFAVAIPFEVPDEDNGTEDESAINNIHDINVLVVDFNRSLYKYDVKLFGSVGVKYDIATSSNKVFDKLLADGANYDACVILNGIEMIRPLRDRFNKEELPILVASYDISDVESVCDINDVNKCLAKPLFPNAIRNALCCECGEVSEIIEDDEIVYDFSGHKVLVVEDNELNTEIILEILKMANMKADHASNGKIGVEMFENSEDGEYSLILMDIQMPVMDGHQATEAIRNSEHCNAKTIPIIAITANAFTSDEEESILRGMSGHISKPINTDNLYTTLKKHVK